MKNYYIADPTSNSQPEDFENVQYVELDFSTNDELDDWLAAYIECFDKDYTNIFIPLSFGQSLSDFLGLQLALYIRCTESPAQYSNLFLYGSETHFQIMRNDFYDVLKMKGIHLIDYSIESIKSFMEINEKACTVENLTEDLNILNLKVPLHLYDNHSVANIWGMYRLLDLAGVERSRLKTVEAKKNNVNSIYFRWLLSKNSVKDIRDAGIHEAEQNRKDYEYKLKGTTVLGKINLKGDGKKRFK